MSRLIQIQQDCNFTTENIRHEFTEYNGARFRITRPVAYQHVNVLTIAKQRIALKLLEEGKNISEIADILGVSGGALITWYQSYLAEIHGKEGQKKAASVKKRNATDSLGRPTKQVQLADKVKNQILVFVSLSACADYLGVSSSTVYNYCNNGKLFRNRYKMSYKEQS